MITDAEYAKSYKELYVLLHYVPKKYIEKLPERVIRFFEENMDRNHEYKVNPNLSYNENKKSHLTNIILGNLFRDYWANPSQREFILKKEKEDREDHQRLLKSIYNPEGIFQNNKQIEAEHIEVDIPELRPDAPTIFEENIFKKILGFIKSLFKG